MEFTVDRPEFQEAVQRTLGIVERKSTIPILNNILITAGTDGIRIVATDREIRLVADYKADVQAVGEITIHARKLYEMVREMEGNTVRFRTGENNQAFITSGAVEYRMPGIPAEDFPEVHLDDPPPSFDMPASFLRNMIRKTMYAASTDETRSTLNGVFFKKDGSVCEMVGTDGHRLALVRQSVPDEQPDGVSVAGIIIPRKGLSEIRKIIDDATGTVTVGVGTSACIVRKEQIALRVSLVDAVYPDYRRVIPSDRGVPIGVEKKRILQSLRRMGVMATDLYSGVVLTLVNGTMRLYSTNPDVGEAQEEIAVEHHDGSFSVGYNVRYLIDAIDALDGDTIVLEMRTNGGPGVIRVPDDDTCFAIVMPINIERM